MFTDFKSILQVGSSNEGLHSTHAAICLLSDKDGDFNSAKQEVERNV